MLQFIKKNKTNFIWVLAFGLMGLILKPLVNLLVSLSNKYPWVTRMFLFLLLVATYFIYKHPLYIIAILLAEPFIEE
ncbi:hypothetical protein DWY30_00695 [Streptococcus salivarius]|uniref:hypothetical protein n=1 Tax=Streptococcus salivarius TaxID=1304 RepID=UPI000E511319|nr:hypothetical protein [Streptococcus salivarius]RGR62801.1 hypothetical protein DWY30_00695 [Streptococcus salivarius]